MGGGASSKPSPPKPPAPLARPWRQTVKGGGEMRWDKQKERGLREACLKDDLKLSKKQKIRILMLGATGSGKSSFVNTLCSALKDEVVQKMHAAASSTTVTKMLVSPHLQIDGKAPYFKIVDAPGIMETDEADYTDFLTKALDGHLKEAKRKDKIPSGGNQKNLGSYVKKPKVLDSPCVVVFVVKAGGYVPDGELKRKFEIAQERAGRHQIKIAVVLTKADILSQGEEYPLKDENVKYMYRSEAARDAVKIASQETGLPENQIFPVTNYTDQTETCTEMHIAALYTLSKILNLAKLEAEERLADDDSDDSDDSDDD